MLKTQLTFNNGMSENLQLCPKCKHGHLKDTGDSAVKVEIKPPLKQPGSSVRERICDHCGHRQIDHSCKHQTSASQIFLRSSFNPL
jgi:hypothetical protein